MKIQTFSIVVGTQACNAKCPFCVSKMTGFGELPRGRAINLRNFSKAVALAERAGTTTVLMTGKGEPTLYPDEVSQYLHMLDNRFPLIELQTNGLAIGRLARGEDSLCKLTAHDLGHWYDHGLDTIALSVVGVDVEDNAGVYLGDKGDNYPDLAETVRYLHGFGFSVRLCVMLKRNGPPPETTAERVTVKAKLVESTTRCIEFCREHRVEQLTIRPIRKPERTADRATSDFVNQHGLVQNEIDSVYSRVAQQGTKLLSLMHGAEVFDVDGQNVCMSDCLTNDASNGDIRTLIFYSNGRITYDWQYEGAVLLGGNPA
jgi:pyruvate-formate lyase-activating enzyme